ncbi:MAG: bifunctional isocitrate dehydrogenase kinase/phosphatase [Bacteroidota bacterium]
MSTLEKLIPYDAAHLVMREYLDYYHRFKRITKRAKIHFEDQDWYGSQQAAKERGSLYRDKVGHTTQRVLEFLGERNNNRAIWQEIKNLFYDETKNFNTRNIAETFYNSVYRHTTGGIVGADEELMFVNATGTYREFKSTEPIFYTLYIGRSTKAIFEQILSLYTLDVEYENFERDIRYLSKALNSKLKEFNVEPLGLRLELLKSVFFRNKGAYIVGRLMIYNRPIPFVLPLLHEEKGIYADTLLLEYNDVSSIFSYNRSYFLVDVDIVSETVDFLRSFMPTKSLGELYNSIGFEKHGKTVFYRDFLRHLAQTEDRFIIAPGLAGMVMLVFTLPSYNMVFKMIRDRFAPPKKVTEAEVKEKYELVNVHDRVGRMTDSHVFHNLQFDRSRFSDELLEELQKETGSKIKVTDKMVQIEHLYVEKRMIPLNIYLRERTPEQSKAVIDEYGKAIKQLAAVNIFPGDMLLKNFGVTRLRRVVFYDYDEIGFLTDYNFRRIPEPRDDYDEFSHDPYFHVGENDIFPEEFSKFLIGNAQIRDIFYELHGDLYDTKFWKDTQKKLKAGAILDTFPYREQLRFKNIEQ